ncbi:CobD/CbiB family protein [Azoarcus taiwanensis]|uniref:Cobalamin biosynthesis protein CobD n=1 Tax=Azoarcus taiwanensis TaxID=666964 RepID=A0A972FDJ1_9RHOO|nr:CobD/CbiB family protein [Azoarcus taiwanensis]NMG03317.1 CobD/CbiB family protein [Azoarcus taiwanensis]
MTVFSLLFALLLEQFKPLSSEYRAARWLQPLADKLVELYDDGSVRSGRVAWGLGVIGLAVASWLVWWALWWVHPLFALFFNVGVLYVVLANHADSRAFGDIVVQLAAGNTDRACELLGQWRGRDHTGAAASEIARVGIETGLVTGHRRVFGPLFWFVLLPGPAGVVLYRAAEHLAEAWRERQTGVEGEPSHFGEFARRAFDVIDWVPVRLTALAFSVLGNFEDAMYCWRSQSVLWPDRASGILIATGAGALGVRLGMPVHEEGVVRDRPEMGIGQRADVARMEAAAKLVWRVLVLVILILALLALAGWVGR